MSMRKVMMMLVGLAMIAWSGVLYAGPGGGGGGPACFGPRHGSMGLGPMGHDPMLGDGPGMMPLVLRAVGLTADQDARVKEILEQHRAAFATTFKELRAANRALQDRLFTPGRVETTDLSDQVARIVKLRETLADEGLKVALEVRGVLTPEQLTKAADIRRQMEALHAQMRSLLGDKED
jgi:Spy/CpxP family protein refolding chaperone